MIKKLFSRSIDSVTAAAFLVGVSSLLSRFLGVIRDRILAGNFGAGDTLDVYYAAFRIPDLIFNLLVLGALSAGFIPVFTQLMHRESGDHEEAWRLANNVINLLGLTMLILLAAGVVGAPWLMKLTTPGFSGDKLEQTVLLTRIMFLSPLLLGLSGVVGGVLQSMKRFAVYSLSPVFYNLGIICGASVLAPRFGIVGLAWGVVLGALLHFLVQVPAVWRLGWRWQALAGWREKNVRIILKMMTARTLSLAINQINLLVITMIASTMASGSLTIFNLANNLQSFPVGIFGISFAIAVFPVLSAQAFNKEKLTARLSASWRQILFFIIPATAIFLLLRAQIIRLILGSGQFDWQDTILTMNCLAWFAVSFFAQALIPLLTRVFYARHDSKTPFYIGLVSALANIALAWPLAQSQGVTGLALAFTVSSFINFFALAVAVKWELGSLVDGKTWLWIGKFTAASLAAAAVIQVVKWSVGPAVDMARVWGLIGQTAASSLAGLAVYLGLCFWWGSPEVVRLWQYLKNFRRRGSGETTDQSEARGI